MGIVQELEERRNAILEEMRSIRSMRRGTINEQYFTVPVKGTEKTKLQGPYYVLSRREGEGTVSQRLRSSELEQAIRRSRSARIINSPLCLRTFRDFFTFEIINR